MGHDTLPASSLRLLLGVLLGGCAALGAAKADGQPAGGSYAARCQAAGNVSLCQADWILICEEAPLTAGHEYEPREQRAMTRLDLWRYSVEEVNRMCVDE